MAAKIPPPPPIATSNPEFNRWLLELTSILSNEGGIDPSEVTGLTAVIAQVDTNTTNIVIVTGSVDGLSSEVATLNVSVTTISGEISTINGQISTLSGEVAALQANPVVHSGSGPPSPSLGNDGDWYGNIGGGVGARIYIKVSGTWTAFPF